MNKRDNIVSLNRFEQMISDHLNFIERQCGIVVRRGKHSLADYSERSDIEYENRGVELFNHVVDLLKRDDYAILKKFSGKSKISTYLNTVISRQYVEIIRKKMGRSREKERAKKLGKVGEFIFDNYFKEGMRYQRLIVAVAETFPGQTLTDKQLSDMIDDISGKRRYNKTDPVNYPDSPVKSGVEIETGVVEVADMTANPEQTLLENRAEADTRGVVSSLLAMLSDDEKLLLKMRFFHSEDEKNLSVEKIAALLLIDKKKVYKKIEKILKKCKKILKEKGVSIESLFY